MKVFINYSYHVQENCFGLLVKNCYLLAPKTAGNNTVVVVRGYKTIITNQLSNYSETWRNKIEKNSNFKMIIRTNKQKNSKKKTNINQNIFKIITREP